MTRASRRRHHIVYRSTCTKTGKSFVGLYSTDNLDDGFKGKGEDLWRSINYHGAENHIYEIVQEYPTRELAKAALSNFTSTDIPKSPRAKKQKVVRGAGFITRRRKHHIIYKTTCVVTGKWYIGCHSTDDLNDGYMGSGTRLWKSIKCYGKDKHFVEILEHCPDRATLIRREAEIVNEDLLAQEQCMNLMLGGSAGPEFKKPTPEETLALISQRSKEMWAKRKADPVAMAEHIKKIATPEIVARRAKSNQGKKRSPDQLARLSAGQKRYYENVDAEVLSERAAKSAIKNSKTWIIEDVDGSRQEVKNLKQFAKTHGISWSQLYKTEHNGKFIGKYRIVGRLAATQ